MQKIITHKDSLVERLVNFKILKSMGFNGGRCTEPFTINFNAIDSKRAFDIGSDFSPAPRWWFVNDSTNYSYIIQHRGWVCDEDGEEVLKGVVFRLPSSKGFLAGWALEDGCAVVEKTLYANEYQALIHADYLAKRESEAWLNSAINEREASEDTGRIEARAQHQTILDEKGNGVIFKILEAA